ncbi:hypothetical protein BD324DRAFT_652257 [Kockovaella imperatae]|uniref:Uncharacterized protein n=1 Tax=Kockovaella imperatae TaxID=4999 RepID=A0A1Y1UCE2_9TREE|nr:hypothetical protein BD324DRAFT_652257 [Kockovaella imperatae]ORX35713.1 hypothetical protein BD324DRAFT_652257 [Kockovaella imperatae]
MSGFQNMNPQQPFYGQTPNRPVQSTNSPVLMPNQFTPSSAAGSSPNMQFGSPNMQQLAEFHRAQQAQQAQQDHQGVLPTAGLAQQYQQLVQQRQASPQIVQQPVMNARPSLQRTPSQQQLFAQMGQQFTPQQMQQQQQQQVYQQRQLQQQQQQRPPQTLQAGSAPAPAAAPRNNGSALSRLTPAQIKQLLEDPTRTANFTPEQRLGLARILQQAQAAQSQTGSPKGSAAGSSAPSPQQRIPQPAAPIRRGSSQSPQIPFQTFGANDGSSPSSQTYGSPQAQPQLALSPQLQFQQLQQATVRPPMNLSNAALQAAQANRANQRVRQNSVPIPNAPSPTFQAPTSFHSPQAATAAPSPPNVARPPAPVSTSSAASPAQPPSVLMNTPTPTTLPRPPSTTSVQPASTGSPAAKPAPSMPSVLSPYQSSDKSEAPPPLLSAPAKPTSATAQQDKPKKKVTVSEARAPIYFASVEPTNKEPVPARVPAAPAPVRPAVKERERLVDLNERKRDRASEGFRGSMRGEISRLMYAAGDVAEPDIESVDLIEDMVADFLTDLCRPVPPIRPEPNTAHQPVLLSTQIVRHRLASHPSLRKYLDRFDIMNHLAGELARSRRIINQTESHFDLVDTVGKDYLGITDEDLAKPKKKVKKSSATEGVKSGDSKPSGTAPEEGRRKPGPKKGWKNAQREGTGGPREPGTKKVKAKSKERSASVTVKTRTSESPAP